MEKYINDHEEENNRTIVQGLLVPKTVKTIKAIWYLSVSANQTVNC